MMTLTLFCALTGLVLGLRYKVLVLCPAIACAILAGVILGLAQHAELTALLLTVTAAAVALQLGYLGGVGTLAVIALARLPRLQQPGRRSSKAAIS